MLKQKLPKRTDLSLGLACLQITFHKRKLGLMRRAMELSIMCDADVALVIFAPDDTLSQYSSNDMEEMLHRYARTCQEPHECRTNQDVSLA